MLTEIMHSAAKGLPMTKYRSHLKPYWNNHLPDLKFEKVRTYRRWVAAGRPRDAGDQSFEDYKHAKKLFSKTLSQLSKQYENEEVVEAVKLAEMNMNSFWKLVRRSRKSLGSKSLAIKRSDGVVVHQVDEVLDVWKTHFANLGTPKESAGFNNQHFRDVTDFVRNYNNMNSMDDTFLVEPFGISEIRKGIKTLNKGKAAGFDNITAEHIIFGGDSIETCLCDLFNMIREIEYVPRCFRTGVQVPLFKGKDLSNLLTDNYRGITLLSSFNKIYEILLWHRMKDWWVQEKVVSDLQGACKSGHSCIHSALVLQETLAASIENNNHCIVAFFDVAKAFDSVWTDGLYKQFFYIGIKGKTWRLLYRSYQNFKCCVKLGGSTSDWYYLYCGIHQGGYMSLIKYTVFINSLLDLLKESQLCCKLYLTPSAPVAYADDLAATCLNKTKMDRAMDIVYSHGRTWRYDFNAKKSGILVFGENLREHETNSKNRLFLLGPERVCERSTYEHVGINVSIFSPDISGIKARRTFNALTGLGIRKSGLTMATCNIVFWSIVIPVALYGCEVWRMNDDSISELENFQNYTCKKIQRFHPRVPNASSLYSMGWMRLERYIQIKKLLFLRSIMVMENEEVARIIFVERAKRYFLDRSEDNVSSEWSVVRDLLNVANLFDLETEVRNMVERDNFYEKRVWKMLVWDKAWSLEDTF